MFNAHKAAAILTHAAYYAWCDEWANHNERLSERGSPAAINLSGCRIADYAPEAPADSWLSEWNQPENGGGCKLRIFLDTLITALGQPQPTEAADELVSLFRSGTPAKGRSHYGRPLCRALLDTDDTASLGYYLAMEGLGHGVTLGDDGGPSWRDIGATLGTPLPHIEAPSWFGEPGAEDFEHEAWGWVENASEAEIVRCLDALGFDSSGPGANRAGLLACMRDGDVSLDRVSEWFAAQYAPADMDASPPAIG